MTDRRMLHPERRTGDTPQDNAAMCDGKVCLTYDQAKAILRRPQSKEKSRVAYKCPACRRWHLGRPIFGHKKRRNRHV